MRAGHAYAAPVVIGLAAGLTAHWLLSANELLGTFDGELQDELGRIAPPVAMDDRVCLVGAGAGTAKALGYASTSESVHKTDYARVIELLAEAGAPVILLDAKLSSPSLDAGRMGDSALARALGNLHGASLVIAAEPILSAEDDEPREDPAAIGGYDYKFQPPAFLGGYVPSVYVGHTVTIKPGTLDLGVNPVMANYADNTPIVHAAAIAALLTDGFSPDVRLDLKQNRVLTPAGSWPLLDLHEVRTTYTRSWRDVPTKSLEDLLRASKTQLRQWFRGKTVIIGDTRESRDAVTTAKFGGVPGLFFMAHTLNTFLKGPSSWQAPVPEVAQALAACLLGVWVAWSSLMSAKRWRIVLPLMASAVSLIVAPLLAFANRTASLIELPVAVFVSWAASALLGLLKFGPLDPRWAGMEREVAVLFVDIKDSTALTNRLGADGYQKVYTEFARRSAMVVARRGGKLERTTGDGFIATFQTGGRSATVKEALKAAQECAQFALEIGGMIAKSGLEVGSASGAYVVEDGRKVWTTQGPSVNMAQRLLSVCDQTGVPIAVGPSAAAVLEGTRSLGTFELKGFPEPVEAFAPEGASPPQVP
ncbi:MAG: CHASE2 domain-containing protein [Armatimonadetes bacterium]|nr:CHASE2 domain-containing protein [Armatimonadota bacterium]